MSRSLLTCCILGLIFLIAGLLYSSSSNRETPAVELPFTIEQGASNLGSGVPGTEKKTTIKVTNLSDEPLVFNATGGCGCMSVVPREGAVAPHCAGLVNVTLRLREEGKDEIGTVKLDIQDSNKKKNWDKLITYYAQCPAPIFSKPTNIDVGRIKKGVGGTWQIAVFDEDGKHYSTNDLKAVVTFPGARIAKSMAEQDQGLLDLELSKECSIGSISGEVLITSARCNRTIRIPITGEVIPKLECAPSVFRVTGNGDETDLSIICWRNDDDELAKPTVVAPKGFVVSEIRHLSRQRMRIRIQIQRLEQVLEEESIVIMFDSTPEGKLAIPVRRDKSFTMTK